MGDRNMINRKANLFRCQSAVAIDNVNDNLGVCYQCNYTFCNKCKETFHFQAMCPKDYAIEQMRLREKKERERIAKQQAEEREKTEKEGEKERKRMRKEQEKALAESARIEQQKINSAKRDLAHQRYREITINLSEENGLLEKILNAEKLEALNTQLCPTCHVRIEKNGGCTHMHCSRCDTHFTWQAPETPQVPGINSLLYHSSNAKPVESIKEELKNKSGIGSSKNSSKLYKFIILL
jgi:hypothetical protein